MNDYPHETMIDRHVTYTLELDGKLYLIENVPARVCVETGEQFFSPATVERIQQTIWNEKPPVRTIETRVFDFAA